MHFWITSRSLPQAHVRAGEPEAGLQRADGGAGAGRRGARTEKGLEQGEGI